MNMKWMNGALGLVLSVSPYFLQCDTDDDDLVVDINCDYRMPTVSNHMFFNPFDSSLYSTTKFMELFDCDSKFFSSLTTECLSCNYFSINGFNRLLLGMPKQFSTFHLNIRSLSKILIYFITFLSSLNYEFSVIALSKTWLCDESTSLYGIPNYLYIYIMNFNISIEMMSLLVLSVMTLTRCSLKYPPVIFLMAKVSL